MLFMDIIVAVILTNYNENSKINSVDLVEINEIRDHGLKIGIPEEILTIIMKNDMLAEVKTKESIQRIKKLIVNLFKI